MEASSVKIGRKAARKITLGGAVLWEGCKYEVLEYLESTGTQYIDTGIVPNHHTQLSCLYAVVGYNTKETANSVFGAYSIAPSTSHASFGVARLIEGLFYFNRIGWGDSTIGSLIDISGYDSIATKYLVFYDKADMYIDGNLIGRSATDTKSWNGSQPIYFFCRNEQGVPGFFSIIKVYNFKLLDDGNLVQNLLPCRRIADGELGMYDTVTKQFFTNQGSGTFVAGPATGTKI